MSISHRIACPDHRHVMTLALAQRHFVDSERFQHGEGGPVHRGGEMISHNPFDRFNAEIEPPADIRYRAVDQQFEYPRLERFRVRAVGIIPVAALSCGRPAVTMRTAIALRSNFNEHLATEHWQV